MAQTKTGHPVQYTVDYPDRQLDRLSSAFRLLFLIPIVLVVIAVAPQAASNGGTTLGAGAGVLFVAPMLMILFRQKYPRPWYDWNIYTANLSYRIQAYALLLRDEYPSTDDEQSVHLVVPYPDVPNELNRWLPLIKWLLSIPHLIALVVLAPIALVAVIIAWFAILFTGRYPRGLFDFVVSVQRWMLRVEAYSMLLTTDRYPPFSLSE
jgi:hypothetical protein